MRTIQLLDKTKQYAIEKDENGTTVNVFEVIDFKVTEGKDIVGTDSYGAPLRIGDFVHVDGFEDPRSEVVARGYAPNGVGIMGYVSVGIEGIKKLYKIKKVD